MNTTASELNGKLWHGITQYHLLVFIGCWMGGIFDGMDSNLFSVMLPNAIQNLTGSMDKKVISQIGSFVTFVFLIGWMLGGIVFGWFGDRYGRVKSMIFSILLYALFTGAAGLAQDPLQLGVCRFLTGLGIGGELVSISTLLAEAWPERSRSIAIGALLTSYQIGVFLSGIITQLIPDWRIVFMVGALPAVLAILLRLKLNEPEKWLEDKAKREHEAHPAMGLSALFQPAYQRNVLVGALSFGALLIGYWASLAWIPTWIQDLLGAGALGSEKSIATMYHGIAAVLGCLSAGPLADQIGRRSTLFIAYLGAFSASALLFLTNTSFSEAIYWQDALLGFFIGLCQAGMYIYLPELFPTRVRATGVGFCLNAGRLASAIAVLFVGSLVAFFGGYAEAAMAFAVPYLIGIAAMYLGRETRGEALPD